jgi:Xaa-Pro dipeptidase
MDLFAIQRALRQASIDGWLLYDFRNRDPFAYHVLGLDVEKLQTRRWFYHIPARGKPKKLVHAVEPRVLDGLPGSTTRYIGWRELEVALRRLLGRQRSVAMQYSPRNHIPYISVADAGTVELVRGFGHKVVSSADLIQQFVSVIDEEGYRLHKAAGAAIDRIRAEAFGEIARAAGRRDGATEYDIQQFIMRRFADEQLTTCSPPMVGVNDHPADPHFEVARESARRFQPGDTVLIDLWAKKDVPKGIYYDITWVGYVGDRPPRRYREIFEVVRDGRDAAIALIEDRFARGRPCAGWEVDEACRSVVTRAGYGRHFLHRTGHSIGQDTHGTGVNIDNLETKDERGLIRGCCFSIEPGIYLPGSMAARTEVNVFIRHDGTPEVTGEIQREIVRLG